MTITITGQDAAIAAQRMARARESFREQVGRAEVVGRWIKAESPDAQFTSELNDLTPERTVRMLARAVRRGDTFLITIDGFPVAWFMRFWLITQYELPTFAAETIRGELRGALRP